MDDCEARDEERPIFSDIRRYFCEFCGICRSKKALISSHILAHHQEEIESKSEEDEVADGDKEANTCEQCGVSFRKPAYLKQHMLSHSLECEALDPRQRTPKCDWFRLDWTSIRSGDRLRSSFRSYVCTVDDCGCSYRRKDHLIRHLLQHKGKLFKCPIENCNHEFSTQSNVKMHVRKEHKEGQPSSLKQCVCPEVGCGKAFRYASQLQKHEESHVKLDYVESLCAEPDCMKTFSNDECLREHIRSSHSHIMCEICGTKQFKKNIKRHLRTHQGKKNQTFKCNYKGCDRTFLTKSNLNKHVKAAHLQVKPFVCCFSGCGMRFAYKHVRDKHEKTGVHVYNLGDFEVTDELFRSMPRGGRKRKYPIVDMLARKRVCPPIRADFLPDFLSDV